jgi:hypothetical protein
VGNGELLTNENGVQCGVWRLEIANFIGIWGLNAQNVPPKCMKSGIEAVGGSSHKCTVFLDY